MSKPLGLGISRSKFRSVFADLGNLKPGVELAGQDNFITEKYKTGAYLQVIGPYKEITEAVLCLPFTTDEEKNKDSRHWMKLFIELIFPKEKESFAFFINRVQIQNLVQATHDRKMGDLILTTHCVRCADGVTLTFVARRTTELEENKADGKEPVSVSG